MRSLFFLFFILASFPSSASDSPTQWIWSLEQAQKLAIASNKLIVVDFWASWCAPCKKMDRESWNTPEVTRKLSNYVPVKIDLDKSKVLANKYGVKGIPYVFILDGNGEVVYKNIGYMRKAEVLHVLEKYALNTKFLSRENLAFFQHENYVTGIRLAEKYLDYSLLVDKQIRNEILVLAKLYLRKADRLLDKQQSNYDLIKDKIELLELTAELYKGNSNKVKRNLDKMDEATLDDRNRNQYAFLRFCLAKEENDMEGSNKWKEAFSSQHYVADNQKRFDLLYDQLN